MNDIYKYFVELYFKKFKQTQRLFFISNTQDSELRYIINSLSNLFIDYPFYHNRIIEETSKIETLDKVTEWQRAYYLSIYKEYHRFSENSSRYYNESINEIASLYKQMEFKNSSFQFLINFKSSIKADINKLQKDDLNMIRNLCSYTVLKSYQKDFFDVTKAKPSSELSQPQIDEIKKKALETFTEMKNRFKDSL
jgi:hypothetical protein